MAGPEVTRRSVLEGAGVALVAGTAGYVGFVALGPAPGSHDASGSGDDGYSGGGDSSGNGKGSGPLAAVDDVPDGGGLVLTDEKLVLTRQGSTVHCFDAVCTHQGCLVGGVSGGRIHCPCHGSAFDATTGAVVQGPATKPLEAVQIVVTDQGEVERA
ncbi:Rieske (2Fe-2S) protein [Cellulomonas sp. ICMP 17802]|uniref:Rieske (2Fe-2S) protein n=1 Tax=Cellulomonas sp. ICMP 17802 TaxID=3239199 RepID=UPI00351B7E5E